MRSRCARSAFSICGAFLLATAMSIQLAAEPTTPADLKKALQAASFTLVGTVTDTKPSRRRSAWGDELIVTTAVLRTDEVLKGAPPTWVPIELEGGTIGDITMEASHTPLVHKGDRAVFLVDRLSDGRYTAHQRGAGILKLRADDRLEDSTLGLNEIRQLAREAR